MEVVTETTSLRLLTRWQGFQGFRLPFSVKFAQHLFGRQLQLNRRQRQRAGPVCAASEAAGRGEMATCAAQIAAARRKWQTCAVQIATARRKWQPAPCRSPPHDGNGNLPPARSPLHAEIATCAAPPPPPRSVDFLAGRPLRRGSARGGARNPSQICMPSCPQSLSGHPGGAAALADGDGFPLEDCGNDDRQIGAPREECRT